MNNKFNSINIEKESSGNIEDPWIKMSKEVQPFKKPTNTSETISKKAESDKYFTSGGIEFRKIYDIDISTEQGKYEFLDSWVSNKKASLEHRIAVVDGEEDLATDEEEKFNEYENEYENNKHKLMIANYQEKTLVGLDLNDKNGILDALKQKEKLYSDIISNNQNISKEALDSALLFHEAVVDLYGMLASEIENRNPELFDYTEIKRDLDSEVTASERKIEQSMIKIDGYFGEDGLIHKTPTKEMRPSAKTEDAEIDLTYAKQDTETFDLLINQYYTDKNKDDSSFFPENINKKEFVSTIDKYINDRTNQINQLMVKSDYLTKGTPEYIENTKKRRQLAKERSSAKRIYNKYFKEEK